MSPQDSSPYLNTYIEILKNSITRLIEKAGKIQLSQEPLVQKSQILEYNKKMHVSALEKFNAPGYLTVINYYLTEKDKSTNNAAGAFIFYAMESNLKKNLESLGQAVAGFDEDDPDQVATKCNQLAQQISDEFRAEIKSKTGKDLIASDPLSVRNTIPEGVPFSFNQYEKSEVSFHVKTVKFLVLEITLVPLGK